MLRRAALVDDARARRFVRRKEVLARYGVTNTTLYRWIRRGHFPLPQRLAKGARTVGWPLTALQAHDATNEAQSLAEHVRVQHGAKKKAAQKRRPRA